MLIEFKVKNFRSFKDEVTFSMVAAKPIKEFEDSHVIEYKGMRLLKSAVIYGANASGKSNLIKAMGFMRKFVLESSQIQSNKNLIHPENYRLDVESSKESSFFEISFIQNEREYRYGFLLSKDRVEQEWLYASGMKKEILLFYRHQSKIKNSVEFKEGNKLIDKTRPEVSFLSVVAQFNGKISLQLVDWFKGFNVMSGILEQTYYPFSFEMLEFEKNRKLIERFLKFADLGISGLDSQKRKLLPNEIIPLAKLKYFLNTKETDVYELLLLSKHDMFKKSDKVGEVLFDFNSDESEGTKKTFALAGPILDTLMKGIIMVIDEFDTKLSFFITKSIIDLFHSSNKNNKNAQLIFATHDTRLLSNKIFRRDQVWFTEKNEFGVSDLYSLADFKIKDLKIRNDASYEKDYLLGKYGSIPFIGDPDLIWSEGYHEQ